MTFLIIYFKLNKLCKPCSAVQYLFIIYLFILFSFFEVL